MLSVFPPSPCLSQPPLHQLLSKQVPKSNGMCSDSYVTSPLNSIQQVSLPSISIAVCWTPYQRNLLIFHQGLPVHDPPLSIALPHFSFSNATLNVGIPWQPVDPFFFSFCAISLSCLSHIIPIPKIPTFIKKHQNHVFEDLLEMHTSQTYLFKN